jgi:hypothetical protein
VEIRATIKARAWRFSLYVVAVVSFGTLIVGGVDRFPFSIMQSSEGWPHATTGNSIIDPVTGFPSGSVEDRQLRSLLTQSGYEGGATVTRVVDPVTGQPYGSMEDQRIRALLTQTGYEGGGTVIAPTDSSPHRS